MKHIWREEESDFKRWASFISLSNMTKDKPDELVFQAVLRGRCLELLAPVVRLSERSQDLFLMGIFSLIDAIVDRPLLEILIEMPIAEDIKSALMGEKGPLRDVYELMLSYEQGEWDRFSALAAKKQVHEEKIPPLYRKALEWASHRFSAAQTVG